MESREYTVTVQRTSCYRAAQERARRRARAGMLRKRVCAAIAFISFFLALGSAGALEQDSIGLAQAAMQLALFLGMTALFSWLAGGFDYEETD